MARPVPTVLPEGLSAALSGFTAHADGGTAFRATLQVSGQLPAPVRAAEIMDQLTHMGNVALAAARDRFLASNPDVAAWRQAVLRRHAIEQEQAALGRRLDELTAQFREAVRAGRGTETLEADLETVRRQQTGAGQRQEVVAGLAAELRDKAGDALRAFLEREHATGLQRMEERAEQVRATLPLAQVLDLLVQLSCLQAAARITTTAGLTELPAIKIETSDGPQELR
ncbi:MAG: hypothetical protein JNM56_12905 [Planctomycetia bacterium]|nr:hypothetical protein [Planctomycetia bacterium]